MWDAISRHVTSEAAPGNRAVPQAPPVSERPDIEAVVIPPSVSGVVLLTGAAEFVRGCDPRLGVGR